MQLYDTLSREKKELPSPETYPIITFYACGPTVYDDTHIGHMRRYMMDDVLKRSLKFMGYDVQHVMNITDVGHLTGDDDSGEDKLEKGAKKQGKTVWDVAKEYEEQFWLTMKVLNVHKEDITVLHATKCIDDMIEIIKKLEAKGHTYQTDEALYFDVTTFPDYGKLSGQKLEDKIQGARDDVRIDTQKKHPADFALWFKRVGRFADHTMHWESPWGDGFPGWHIECSAMSMKGLRAETIDIHTGGIDHIPVHHENEIAQSEGATGKEFVKYWVHHAFLQVDGQKMSKSKQNFYSLKDIEAKGIDPLALRYLFLQTHYRKPMNFTWEAVQSADNSLKGLRAQLAHVNESSTDVSNEYTKRAKEYLADDLNTAQMVALLHEVTKSNLDDQSKTDTIMTLDSVLGLDLDRAFVAESIPDMVTKLAEKRKEARKANDFTASDILRDKINASGYEIEDHTSGYVIKKK
ncbi:MAG: cysteine--tRNA ligase [bacterium]|nr:cysteine--tRNA ligase [bacterium]